MVMVKTVVMRWMLGDQKESEKWRGSLIERSFAMCEGTAYSLADGGRGCIGKV